jgi:hypothetical protein
MLPGTDMILSCMQGPALSLEEIDEIPANMAGIWAYIMWEHAGCPNRSSEEADREYQQGISELQQCLCRGKTLDELWKVCSAAHFAQLSQIFVILIRFLVLLTEKFLARTMHLTCMCWV